MQIAYIRVSTEEQNEARQVEAMEKFGIERWYIEKVSGKSMRRDKLLEMLDFCREGDVIHIHDFSRLARSTKDLLQIVELLQEKKVSLVSNKEALDTSTATGKLMLTMIAAINEFERMNLLERQREGIAIAKKNGRYKGRAPVKISDVVMAELYRRWKYHRESANALAKEAGVAAPTLRKYLKLWEMEHEEAMDLHETAGGAADNGTADADPKTAPGGQPGGETAEE